MRSIRSLAVGFVLAGACVAGVSAQNQGEAYDHYLKLTKLAPQTYKNGDAVEAAAQAKELLTLAPSLSTDWNYGNAVHTAHLVLGRIALDEGKLSEAKKQLLLSVAESAMPYGFVAQPEQPWEQRPKPGKWKASPQMDTFGPDMLLASELLKKGEKDTVIKYLDACGKFWTMNEGRIAKWKQQIEEGETPDFGPNMVYFAGN